MSSFIHSLHYLKPKHKENSRLEVFQQCKVIIAFLSVFYGSAARVNLGSNYVFFHCVLQISTKPEYGKFRIVFHLKEMALLPKIIIVEKKLSEKNHHCDFFLT